MSNQEKSIACFQMKYLQLVTVLILVSVQIHAQEDVLKAVQLDEVIISAQADGFDVPLFVAQVMEDTSFYKSFLNMKTFPHQVRSGLRVRNKREKETATLEREGALHTRANNQVELLVTSDRESGNLRNRKGEMRYMTAEMYEEVFWPKGRYPANNTILNREQELVKGSKMDEYKSELKKFMFNPGQEIGSVPFIGKKMALFEPDMVRYYDYLIWADQRRGRNCWVFSADAKPEFGQNKTVIKSMDTWFDKNTWQVRARHYHIQHSTILLDFDITIKVENTSVNGSSVPMMINYDGQFDLPLKKPEIIRFWLQFSSWDIPMVE
jgi:hypothetical protein